MRKLLVGVGILSLLGVGACFALPVVRGPIVSFMTGRGIDAPSEDLLQSRYRVAPGYTLELFAEDILTARFMRFSPGGALLISQPRQNLTLLFEASDDLPGVKTAVHDLQRHFPLNRLLLAGQVNSPHPTLAQLTHDLKGTDSLPRL